MNLNESDGTIVQRNIKIRLKKSIASTNLNVIDISSSNAIDITHFLDVSKPQPTHNNYISNHLNEAIFTVYWIYCGTLYQ